MRFSNHLRNEFPGKQIGVDFIHKIAQQKEQEFTVRFLADLGNSDILLFSSQASSLSNRFIASNSVGRNKEFTAQIDYTQKVYSNTKVETGLKSIFRAAATDFLTELKSKLADDYTTAPYNSNQFDYKQQVYSVYGNVYHSIQRWNFRLGLRGKQTVIYGKSASTADQLNQHYWVWATNLQAIFKPSATHQFIFSYTKRLERPSIQFLNPFVNKIDTFSTTTGNPHFKPQYNHVIAVTDQMLWGRNSLIFAVSYQPGTGTFKNICGENQWNVSMNFNTKIGSYWSLNASFSPRYTK